MAEEQTPSRPGCGAATASAGEHRRCRLSRRPRSRPRPCSRSSRRATGSTPTTIWPWSPVGVGKSWLACAIGQKAVATIGPSSIIAGQSSASDLALARGDGRHPRLIKSIGRADLLILDDFGLEPLRPGARHDLLEILEERYGRRSTVVTSQLPLSTWHEVIGDPTYADAILDRLVHNAHRIELTGKALRRARGNSPKRLEPEPRNGKNFLKPTSAAPRGGIIPLQGGGSSRNPWAQSSVTGRAASSESAARALAEATPVPKSPTKARSRPAVQRRRRQG